MREAANRVERRIRKSSALLGAAGLALALSGVACDTRGGPLDRDPSRPAPTSRPALESTHGGAVPTSPSGGAGAPPVTPVGAESLSSFEGQVLETMDAEPYTYVQVTDGQRTIWAAGPKVAVAAGDRVRIASGMLMVDFPSRQLERTFAELYLSGAIEVVGASGAGKVSTSGAGATSGSGSTTMAPTSRPAAEDYSGLERPEGGLRVGEIYEQSVALVGTEILFRGKVVKYNGAILGTNWLHVRDGSGDSGKNDITVTTNTAVKVGDIVLVRGKLSADRDFGAGYRYDLIVEDADVTAEPAP
ncbi:MAG: hypothetical protein KDC38_17655 [Planctomycetes bacterium]|nr:hypothetical protein [Planctomycetota bacterium]